MDVQDDTTTDLNWQLISVAFRGGLAQLDTTHTGFSEGRRAISRPTAKKLEVGKPVMLSTLGKASMRLGWSADALAEVGQLRSQNEVSRLSGLGIPDSILNSLRSKLAP